MEKGKRRSLFSQEFGDLPENDDALEQNRRRSIASPVIRKSTSSSTHDMMVHFAQCLKLSSENKINPGNAFQLQMIDYMMSMLSSKDSKMDNFQIASFTLDASTKIYASRVDKIHSDGVRIAGGLFKAVVRKEKLAKAEEEHGEDDDEIKAECKTKRRVQVRRKKILAQPTVLDAPLQQNYKLVPSFMFMKAMFSDCRPGFVNFMWRITVNDNMKQRFLFSELAFEIPQISPQNALMGNYPKIPALGELKISPHNIEPADFLADELSSGLSHCDINEKLNVSYVTEKLKMDLQLENNFEDEPCQDVGVQDDVGAAGDGGPPTVGPEQSNSLDIRCHLSQKPQEYSYFNVEKLTLWRGPSHWKLFSSKGKQEGSKKLKTKQKKKKVVKEIFTAETVPIVDDKLQTGKPQRLAKRTTQRWRESNVASQVDVHFDSEQFRGLSLNGNFSLQFMNEQKLQKPVPEVVDDDNVVEYDYGNPNDTLEYCPNVPDVEETFSAEDTEKVKKENARATEKGEKENAEATEKGETENTEATDKGEKEFAGATESEKTGPAKDDDKMWKLLTPPHQASKISIPYAKEPKKIDMAKLKSTMWSIILKFSALGNSNPEEVQPVINRAEGMATLLSQLHKETRKVWPEETRAQLSFAIVFQALLHLANEKRIKLKNVQDLSDIIIFWPRESPPSRG